jgi:hypothetical protein
MARLHCRRPAGRHADSVPWSGCLVNGVATVQPPSSRAHGAVNTRRTSPDGRDVLSLTGVVMLPGAPSKTGRDIPRDLFKRKGRTILLVKINGEAWRYGYTSLRRDRYALWIH